MARAGCKTNGLQKLEGDDIEKSLELLDRVLSEFEDPDSLPQIEPESPSQDNQSEDDGYMSMNGRRAKISPDFCHNRSPDHEESQINHESQSESLSSFTLPDIRTIAAINRSVIKTDDDDDDGDGDDDVDDVEETKSSTSLPLSSMVGKIDDGMILNLLPRSLSTETTINKTNSSTSNNNNNTVVVVKSSKDYDKLTNNKSKSKDFQNIFTDNNVDFSNNKRKSQQTNLDSSLRVNEKDDNDKDHGSSSSSSSHKKNDDNVDKGNNDCSSNSPLDVKQQITSPKKSRPLNVIPSRYSSLPCNGPIKNSLFSGSFDGIEMKGTTTGNGSFDDERNVLGIGISAVHDAVLRGGVAKLPEPIVNEHPVTIYPGRASPPRTTRVPPRTLPGSIERHREVCRNPNFSTITTDNGGRIAWQIDKTQFIPLKFVEKTTISAKIPSSSSTTSPVSNEHTSQSSQAIQSFKRYHNKYMDNDFDDNNDNNHHFFIHHSNNSSPSQDDYFIAEDKNQFIKNFVASANKQNNIDEIRIRNKQQQQLQKQEINCDSEEFSDDSLEGQSLPPPPPPPVVPPPPSLSAPVTPSKRGSIAWEISLDDNNFPPPPPLHQSHSQNSTMHSLKRNKTANKEKASSKHLESSSSLSSSKPIKKSRERNVLGSQSSLNSTPGNSINSLSNNYSLQSNNLRNRASSVEWPEPPDPPVCTTEDEAASLYSDSDDLIPVRPATMTTNQGTYVIRKGRRERNRLPDFNNFLSPSSLSNTNYRLSNRSGSQEYSQSQIIFTPHSRHSIDLGSSPQISTQNSALSPRSRLSLDLNPHPVPATSEQYRTADLSNNSGSGINKINSGNSPITSNNNSTQKAGSLSSCYSEFEIYDKTDFDVMQQSIESNNSNNIKVNQIMSHDSNTNLNCNAGNIIANNTDTVSNSSESLKRGSPITTIGQQQQQQQQVQNEIISTPRRELAPPIEEDEEQDSESQRVGVPLRQIENNISALLRGDIAVARIGDISHARRPLGFRPGVHKSESAKEMLLAQLNAFGPLPPSPPSPRSSSPEPEIDRFPPLPPSPKEIVADNEDEPENENISSRDKYGFRINSRTRLKSDVLQLNRDEMPPAVPPHRGMSSLNTLKTRSMDTSYSKKYMYNTSHSNNSPGTLPSELPTTRKRLMSGALPKRSGQNSREEIRLQTSCSLPETPIFARGCDIARTPHRRVPDTSNIESRTAPRTNTINSNLNSSIAGIGGGGSGQRCMNQILVSGEMLRLAGGPARGWYPKQRNMRPASTEHLDRLHRSQRSMRAWDANSAQGTGGGNGRKPLTLPPNLTPKFFNKSPREALRRVTSLLIKKGNDKGKDKESKREKEAFAASAVHRSPGSAGDIPVDKISITDVSSVNNQQQQNHNHHHKKKGFFKSFWKKSRHYSLDQ